MDKKVKQEEQLTYSGKVWIQASIYALVVVVLLLFKATFSVLLLIFAGSLIAVFFRGLSGLICRKTNWKEGICLTISIVGTLLLVVGFFWLVGAKVQEQISELTETLPKTIENAKTKLNDSNMGRKLLTKIEDPDTMKQVQQVAGTFFRSTFGIFGDLYVILFLGIFLTISPLAYTKGIVKLVPPKGQKKTDEVLEKLGENLKKWLKGQFLAMFIIFVLTSIGLLIIGVPMWLALALIAGVLNFIPNFGPLIAMIPAVLVALMISPVTALIVAGMYILIQTIEGVITPIIQQKLISIPPAVTITAQLLISPLTGGWGLVLATPLMLLIITLVQELYINPRDEKAKNRLATSVRE